MIMLAYGDQCGSIFRKNAEIQDAKYSMSKRSLRHRKDNLEQLYIRDLRLTDSFKRENFDVKKATRRRN